MFKKKKQTKIKFEVAPDEVFPKCPYCKKELNKIWTKNQGFIQPKTTLLCPHCQCFLGYGTYAF